jgi:hypothetical protein
MIFFSAHTQPLIRPADAPESPDAKMESSWEQQELPQTYFTGEVPIFTVAPQIPQGAKAKPQRVTRPMRPLFAPKTEQLTSPLPSAAATPIARTPQTPFQTPAQPEIQFVPLPNTQHSDAQNYALPSSVPGLPVPPSIIEDLPFGVLEPLDVSMSEEPMSIDDFLHNFTMREN